MKGIKGDEHGIIKEVNFFQHQEFTDGPSVDVLKCGVCLSVISVQLRPEPGPELRRQRRRETPGCPGLVHRTSSL